MKQYRTIDHDYKEPTFTDKFKYYAVRILVASILITLGIALLMLLPIILFIVVPLIIMLFLIFVFLNKDNEIINVILSKYKYKK